MENAGHSLAVLYLDLVFILTYEGLCSVPIGLS